MPDKEAPPDGARNESTAEASQGCGASAMSGLAPEAQRLLKEVGSLIVGGRLMTIGDLDG